MNFLWGAGTAILLIGAFEIWRFRRWSKKLDRRYEIELEMRDWERDERLRAAGVAEDGVIQIREAIEKARRERDPSFAIEQIRETFDEARQ